ncbi:Hpt domain-containing response regulator [Trinickia acidisoli]|uniref:Hpt domain-containing response regulator n=1 Tax=Trinickia acidisoli TaxID=2767482 RepID=UPI001A902F92|nr:response regulator [Trinickia acidisoli]
MLDILEPIATHAADQVRILVVDDDTLARLILADQLDALGYRLVDTAVDGGEALRWALSRPYDLVITDLCMPDMGGEALLAALRAHGLAMPVIAGTAWREPVWARTSGAPPGGFAAVLRKPIGITQLRALLRAHIGSTVLGGHGLSPDTSRRRALREAFAAAWPGDEEDLRAALASVDATALLHRLHRLHGALAVLGEARAQRACARLQVDVRSRGIETSAARIERFMRSCARIGRRRNCK